MQSDRTGNCAPPAATVPPANTAPRPGRVRGLGVTDAVCVEFDADQIPWLIDEIELLCRSIQDHLSWHAETMDSDDVDRRHYQLKVLAMIRAQIPTEPEQEHVEIVGPQATMTELVHGAASKVTECLVDDVRQGRSVEELDISADLTQLWMETHIELLENSAYRFDPEYDPIHTDALE